MKKRVTLPWSAAAWRQSTYEPRVRKVHGPVGNLKRDPNVVATVDACRWCGHHVCSCERQAFRIHRQTLDAWRDTTPREGGTLTRESLLDKLRASKSEPVCTCRCGAKLSDTQFHRCPREYMSRGALYARKYGAGVPVPAEPTLMDAPVPPNPGPAGPRSAFDVALDAKIKNLMESASIHLECDQLGVACVCEACNPA